MQNKITPEQNKIIADTLALIKAEMKKGYLSNKRMILTVKRPDDCMMLDHSPKNSPFGTHKIIMEFLKP